MFREMRRSKQQLSREEAAAVLERGTTGVLAVSGDDGYPYAVPVNYVYAAGKIFFHCAVSGHKLDAIGNCDKVSFCVIDRDEAVPEALTTRYRSVIAFGRAEILDDPARITAAMRTLGLKFSPDAAKIDAEIRDAMERFRCVQITVEHLTGKASIELIRP